MARREITRVGVRKLRQHLSRYLRRVLAGERLEITDRGRPVARLEPLTEPSTATARLVAAGRATAPEGDLLDLPPSRREALEEGDRGLAGAPRGADVRARAARHVAGVDGR